MTIIRDKGPLKGTFVIDPSLPIPTSFLPSLMPSETDTKRNNLNLETKSVPLDVDIYIVQADEQLPPASGDRQKGKQTRQRRRKSEKTGQSAELNQGTVAVQVKGSSSVFVKMVRRSSNTISARRTKEADIH